MRDKWCAEPAVTSVVRVLVGWCVFSGERSTVVGPEEVGNTGRHRVGFAEVGAGMVERIGRPDCLLSSFGFVLSWMTKLLEAVWMSSTMLGCSNGNLLHSTGQHGI